MAEELGLDELWAHALNNVGVARVDIGDRGGLGDLERSLEIAVAISSPESRPRLPQPRQQLRRACDLRRAFELYELGRAAAERFGDAGGLRWFSHGAHLRAVLDRSLGRGGRARRAALHPGRGRPAEWMELDASLGRGWIRLARGDVAGAVSDSERALEFARRADNPQTLFPALAFHARALLSGGCKEESNAAATELLTSGRAAGQHSRLSGRPTSRSWSSPWDGQVSSLTRPRTSG